MFICKGCKAEIQEDNADHIFHCEGKGWDKNKSEYQQNFEDDRRDRIADLQLEDKGRHY